MRTITDIDIAEIADIAISSNNPDSDIMAYCEKNGIDYDDAEIQDRLFSENIERCHLCEHYFYSYDLEFTSNGSLCVDCGGVPEGMEDES